MCHCLCLLKSYQLFLCGVGDVCIAGLWQCVMLSLVLSQCCKALGICSGVCLSVSVSLAIIHRNPSAWIGSSGVSGNDPQWSTVVLYLQLFSPLPLITCLLGGWAVLRRPGSMSCLPHSLCLS